MSWRPPTLALRLPSALAGLTAVFGMGTGVPPLHIPPRHWSLFIFEKNHCSVLHKAPLCVFVVARPISTPWLKPSRVFYRVPINLVVFEGSQMNSNLGNGFTLRCFQRLSVPNFATQLCRRPDSWYTRGSSIPVLSY